MGELSLWEGVFWVLLEGCRLPGATAAAAVMKKPSLWEVRVLGSTYWAWASGATAVTAGMEEQACWLVPSVTHAAVGALEPAYTGTQVSMAFQGEG
jgi:hypothetical protein